MPEPKTYIADKHTFMHGTSGYHGHTNKAGYTRVAHLEQSSSLS